MPRSFLNLQHCFWPLQAFFFLLCGDVELPERVLTRRWLKNERETPVDMIDVIDVIDRQGKSRVIGTLLVAFSRLERK